MMHYAYPVLGLAVGLNFFGRSIMEVVREPYMDEVFHIPQAQHFCKSNFIYTLYILAIIIFYMKLFLIGEWVWDDKITTLPGLYLISLAYVHASTFISSLFITLPSNEIDCSITQLRLMSWTSCIVCFIVIQRLLKQLQPDLVKISLNFLMLDKNSYTLYIYTYRHMFSGI